MEEYLKPKGADRVNTKQLYDDNYRNMETVVASANAVLEDYHVKTQLVRTIPYEADYGYTDIFGRLCDITRPIPESIENDLTIEYMNLWEFIIRDAVVMNKFEEGVPLWSRYVDSSAKDTTILLSKKAPASFRRALQHYLYGGGDGTSTSNTNVHFVVHSKSTSAPKQLNVAESVKSVRELSKKSSGSKGRCKLAFITWSPKTLYDCVVAFSVIDVGGAVYITLRDLNASIYTLIMIGSMLFHNIDISTGSFGVTSEFTVVFCDKIENPSPQALNNLRELAEYVGPDEDLYTNINLRGGMRSTHIDIILTAKMSIALNDRYNVLLVLQKQLIRSSKTYMSDLHLRKWALSELNGMFDSETAQRMVIRLEPSLWKEAYEWDKYCT